MSIFDSVPLRRPQRSSFDLSHEVKTSTNFGQLTPILCREVLPGDTWSVNSEVMLRFAPLIAPVMHRINVTVHFFFVPNRLLWDKWEDFITGGKDGLQAPLFPTFNPTALKAAAGATNVVHTGSLMDYFGMAVPPGTDAISDLYPNNADNLFNCLPFKAYTKVYNDYYRDQNLQDEVDLHTNVDGDNSLYWQNFIMRYRAYEKDYFTSSLPWTQRGGDVQVPMDGVGTVYYDDVVTGHGIFRSENGQPFPADYDIFSSTGGRLSGVKDAAHLDGLYDPNGTLSVDFPETFTIETLRQSARLQEFLEKNARAGARYTEQLLAHFGVRSSDARLQRAEYLGGGKQNVVISEVLQTSSSDDTSPQANMSGHALSVGNSNKIRRFFEEHGWIIGIMSILPKSSYQQGVPRQFMKHTKFDFAFPEFAQLGEQPVWTRELFVRDDIPGDEVFGYQQRYCEYKYIPSLVTGDMRDTLSYWHCGRIFDDKPGLNNAFVEMRPADVSRIFAVEDPSFQHLYCHIFNSVICQRPLPKFNIPAL